MTTACIVQARMGSTRLPGKMMLPLGETTVIGEVLTRCWQIPGVDIVIAALPDTRMNDMLAEEASNHAPVYRGPENDVLARYYGAAMAVEADHIIRVTGDCPRISPEVCGAVLTMLVRNGADYCSNVDPRTFPQGYDCEAFTIDTLQRAQDEAEPLEREHVTTWMRRAGIVRVNLGSPWHMDGRMVLDTIEDYRALST